MKGIFIITINNNNEKGIYMKKIRKRVLSSLLLVAIIGGLFRSMVSAASAATVPYYYTLLAVAGGDGDCVVNRADVGTATLKQSDVFNLEGWVYSTVKFSSYTITFAKGNNPPSKTIEAKVEKFPFPEEFKAYVKATTNKTFTVENSKWSASVRLSDLSVGTWTVMVKGRVVGDANSTYDIAKVMLTIKATGTGPNNYAVCNDTPNPNAVKQYVKNGASKIEIPNHFVYGNTTSFSVSGWAIHDRGIDSYSYTIKDKASGAIVYGKENKYISALDRSDLGPTAKKLMIATDNNTYHTWYNGSIYIAGMAAGTYVAYIHGKTLDGQTFKVCEITFTIEKGYVTAKEGNNTVDKISAPIEGISKTLTIQSNGGTWSAEVGADGKDWVQVTPDKKNNKLVITVLENTARSSKKRSTKVTLKCGGVSRQISITQDPAYHEITLLSGEGTFSDGTEKKTFLVKDGSFISERLLLSMCDKPSPKTPGMKYKLFYFPGYRLINYIDVRNKEASALDDIYDVAVRWDMTLQAYYWIDLTKYTRFNPDMVRVSSESEVKTAISKAVSTITSLTGSENETLIESNAKLNINTQKNEGKYGKKDNSLIFSQSVLKNYYLGLKTMNRNGCGPVACYNARLLLGLETDLVEMVNHIEKSGYMMFGDSMFNGALGLNPKHIKDAINYDNKNLVKVQEFYDSKAFDEVVHFDLLNMRGKDGTDKVVYIVCFWNQDAVGTAHYVCFTPGYDDGDEYPLDAYNNGRADDRQRFNSVLGIINGEDAYGKLYASKFDRFIAGFKITLN